MQINDCYLLGYVGKKHGLRGEVTISFDVDDPQEYEEMESVFLKMNNQLVPFFIESLSLRGGKKAVVKFEGIDSTEQADELQSTELYLPSSCLPDLEEGQYYYHDLIGCTVIDRQAGELGKVKEVLDLTSQMLFSVEYRGEEVMVPISDGIILEVKTEEGIVRVDLPDGLLDVYLDKE